MRMGRPASEIMGVMARKEGEWQETLTKFRARKQFDAPCPCGSGLTFGECHGWMRSARGRRGRGRGAGCPRPSVRTRTVAQD